ncbi:MAG: 50S ribosomal protein L29 [Planctomycetaceae bacterium]|nr:50S ribosomal protein L29 [Planctomycetaceae bacterium]
MKIEDCRAKTDSELRYDMNGLKKELFGLRFRSVGESNQNPSRIREARRAIARINTVLHERATGIRGQNSR